MGRALDRHLLGGPSEYSALFVHTDVDTYCCGRRHRAGVVAEHQRFLRWLRRILPNLDACRGLTKRSASAHRRQVSPGRRRPLTGPPPGYTGPPPPGSTGATRPSIFTKGWLIAVAAVIAAIIAAVAAFFVLRPDPSQQRAAQQSPTTTTSPPPGATPGVATPGTAPPAGPWLRGTYNWQNSSGQAGTATVTSDCPACDATITSEGRIGIYHWTGTGWTFAEDCRTETVTPIGVVNGIVQEASTQASGCGARSNTGTLTRIGD